MDSWASAHNHFDFVLHSSGTHSPKLETVQKVGNTSISDNTPNVHMLHGVQPKSSTFLACIPIYLIRVRAERMSVEAKDLDIRVRCRQLLSLPRLALYSIRNNFISHPAIFIYFRLSSAGFTSLNFRPCIGNLGDDHQ